MSCVLNRCSDVTQMTPQICANAPRIVIVLCGVHLKLPNVPPRMVGTTLRTTDLYQEEVNKNKACRM